MCIVYTSYDSELFGKHVLITYVSQILVMPTNHNKPTLNFGYNNMFQCIDKQHDMNVMQPMYYCSTLVALRNNITRYYYS